MAEESRQSRPVKTPLPFYAGEKSTLTQAHTDVTIPPPGGTEGAGSSSLFQIKIQGGITHD